MAYQKGSGFVGLQQYLGANQGAAQRMGGQLAADLNKSVGDVQNEINVGANTFNTQAAAGTPQYDTTTAMLEGGALGEAARNGQIRYTGPATLRDVVDTDQLGNRVADVGRQGALAATDAGRATLLQERYGQNYSSTGGRSLDAFLAGAGGGAALAGGGNTLGSLKAYLGTAVGNAPQTAAAGARAATDLSEQYKKDFPVAQVPATPAPVSIGPAAPSATGQVSGGRRERNGPARYLPLLVGAPPLPKKKP